MASSDIPKPVRRLADGALVVALCLVFVTVLIGAIWVLTLLGMTKISAPDWTGGQAFFVEAALAGVSFLVRWGILRRKKMAYWICRVVFFPALLDEIIWGKKDYEHQDWLTKLLTSPETEQWFFGHQK